MTNTEIIPQWTAIKISQNRTTSFQESRNRFWAYGLSKTTEVIKCATKMFRSLTMPS